MPLIRHVAAVPTATEQRCVRCCEVIAQRGNPVFSCDPFWPGVDCVTNDIRTPTPKHYPPQDCKPVDLTERGHDINAPVAISPGKYSAHRFWGDPTLHYPCGHCGMSFQSGNHVTAGTISEVLL